jgi:hypothetical protein
MKRATMLCTIAAASAAIGSGPGLAHPSPPVGKSAVQLRLGGFLPAGGGELWETNEEVFTLEASDLDGVMLGMSFVHSMSNRLEAGLNIDFYSEQARSEYRDFVDQDGFPIVHDTELSTVPLTVDLRFLPWGRAVRPVFYIGGGAGVSYWGYEEVGDFIDFALDPPEVFTDGFEDSDAALEVHALAGLELPLARTVNLILEGRVSSADDEPTGDLGGLGRIELGGVSFHAAAAFRF